MSRHGHRAGAPPPSAPEPSFAEQARTLLHLERTGTLGTLSRRHPGHPFVSIMPYAPDRRGRPLFLISALAMHTQNLEADARASLLVALNGDASARRLGKGPGRPLNALEDRLALVAALECVDAVTWFDEDTPAALIDACRPEVLVKGGDWPVERIVGAPQVLARGGAVHSIPFEHQRSTTALLRRIENRGSRVSPLPAPSEAAARRRSRPASGSPSKRRAAQSRARGRGRSR